MPEPIMQVRGVRKVFDGVTALSSVSLEVYEREVLAIIGPNGAGKTTLFNLISRVFPVTDGDIVFRGVSITHTPAHRMASLGIARTFQNLQIFGHMTVLENVMVGCHNRSRSEMLSAAFTLPASRREEARLRERSTQLLETVGLADRASHVAGNLNVGQQRLLEFARVLAMEPSLVLLDEPAAGLNTRETAGLSQMISRLARELSLTVVLIEHDMSMVMGVSDRVIVLDHGEKIAEGTPQEVQQNPRVIAAYLGAEEAE